MKLLWLSHLVPFPPTGHGTLQRSHHLFKETCRRHEVHLVALSSPAVLRAPGEIERAARELSAYAASVQLLPLPRKRWRRPLTLARTFLTPVSFWEAWFESDPMRRHLRHLLATTSFDLVHVETVFLARYLEMCAGTPVVMNHHNIESHLLQRRAASQSNPLERVFFAREARKVNALERAIVPRVAWNVVVSDLDGQRLRHVVSDAQATTVTNGVDVEFFKVTRPSGGPSGALVFAGGMDWFPNRDAIEFFAREIWPALLQDDARRTMTLIGRKPPPAAIEAAADPRFRVLGFVDDVRPHIEAAAIYVCPMRVGGGTRLKILDALAMTRPLVSTGMGVEGLGLIDGQHYLRAETPSEFVSQIKRLEASTELRRRLVEAGREFVVRRYSWPRVAQSLEDAFTEALRASSALQSLGTRASPSSLPVDAATS